VFDFAGGNGHDLVPVSAKTKTVLTILCLPVIFFYYLSCIYGVRYWSSEVHNEKGLIQSKWGESYEEEIRRREKSDPAMGVGKEETQRKVEDLKKIAERNYQTAIAEYQTSIKYNPTFLSAYYKLAHAYNSIGDAENSLKTYRALQKYSPDYAEVHYNLGIVLSLLAEKAQDQTQAAKHREEALREFKIAARMST